MGQALGPEAKEFTHRWIVGRPLRLTTAREERDPYNRLLAFVASDESSLNPALVQAGLATVTVYPPNTGRVDELLKAQESAHSLHRGIWGPAGPSEEPGSYRAVRRKESKSASIRPLRYEHHIVVGNKRSGIAHWPGCRHVDEMSPKNIRYFSSVAAARSAGYKMEKGRR